MVTIVSGLLWFRLPYVLQLMAVYHNKVTKQIYVLWIVITVAAADTFIFSGETNYLEKCRS